MKPIRVEIPESVFKLPVHEALIEMLNIAREKTYKKVVKK
jgi:hypothetical protein